MDWRLGLQRRRPLFRRLIMKPKRPSQARRRIDEKTTGALSAWRTRLVTPVEGSFFSDGFVQVENGTADHGPGRGFVQVHVWRRIGQVRAGNFDGIRGVVFKMVVLFLPKAQQLFRL